MLPRWTRLHPCRPGVLFAGEDAHSVHRQTSPPYEYLAGLGSPTCTHTILSGVMPPEISVEGQMGGPWVQEEHQEWGWGLMVVLIQAEGPSLPTIQLTHGECLLEE